MMRNCREATGDYSHYYCYHQIKSRFGGVDVCVNSAGLSHDAPLLTGSVQQWREMFEVHLYKRSIIKIIDSSL